MSTKVTLGTAIKLTSELFEHKTDNGGHPYVLHCLRVMNSVDPRDKELQMIAVMHDNVEDTDLTLDDLSKMGFSQRVVTAVGILTHDPEEPYDDYIKRIATNEDARKVKLADLQDNSNITRLKGLRRKDFDRIEKYHKAFVYLSN